MTVEENIRVLKRFWNWIWNSDSILSWIVALVFIFIFVKYLFFPSLSFVMGTSLPLAGVESSSMDHQIVKDDFGLRNLCGRRYSKDEVEYVDFDKYWEKCGGWYEEENINKEYFLKFPLKNGFKKGDIVVVWGRFKPKIGDIIIFKPNEGSSAPRPIVHRIVSIKNEEEIIIGTKGDHNEGQLTKGNNFYSTDETNIKENQIVGRVIFKVPYLGWVKIWFVELFKIFFSKSY